jgi:response regulator RpfG family c-di-GMP phosphodiesterase
MDQNLQLLFVDDESHVKMFSIVLRKNGFDIKPAYTIQAAYNLIEKEEIIPDVAIIHLGAENFNKIPLDGAYKDSLLITKLLQDKSNGHCRIVIWSGQEFAELRPTMNELGIWAYIRNPIDYNDFLQVVEFLKQGSLQDDEIGRPARDIIDEIQHSTSIERF